MLDINLNWYKSFLTVADSKSLTEASNKLNISVPAISKNIINLEEFLGMTLFYRTNNGMRLTLAGKELYEYIDEGFSCIDLGEKLVLSKKDIANGEISIGVPTHIATSFLMKPLREANKDYPNLQIKIISRSDGLDLLNLLENHKVDFVIDNAQRDITNKDIVKETIKEVENILIAKENIKISNIKELENLTYLLPFEDTHTTRNLEEQFKKNNICIKNKKEMDMSEVRTSGAKEGIGIGYVIKETVTDELKRKELYELKIPFELPKSTINLFYLNKQLTYVDKEFIKKYLKKS